MKKLLLIATLLTSCVSAKQYSLLKKDYQSLGQNFRSIEQENKILFHDLRQMKSYLKDSTEALKKLKNNE